MLDTDVRGTCLNVLTRRHVEGRSATKVRGEPLGSRESKVGKLNLETTVANQYVLGLEVAVVDAQSMAVLNSTNQLQKDTLGHVVVADVAASLGDVCKEISLGAVLHDDVGAVRSLQDFHQRNNIVVPASLVVETNLALLEASLAGVQASGRESLDGVGRVRDYVDGVVNDSIRTNTQHRRQLQPMRQQLTDPVLGTGNARA